MKRYGEGELLLDLAEALDAGDDAARRNGEVASTDLKAAGRVEHAEGGERLAVIRERLALAHEHNTRHTLIEVIGNMKDLVDHLAGGKGPREAEHACRTERAPHAASRLGGNADGKFVASGHADRLDGNAVGELEQVLARAIAGNLLGNLLGRIEGEELGKLCSERLGKVRHIIKRTNVLIEDPFAELFGAKNGLTEFGGQLLQVLRRKIADIAMGRGSLHELPFGENEV